jgi:hypothetical protein
MDSSRKAAQDRGLGRLDAQAARRRGKVVQAPHQSSESHGRLWKVKK